MFKCEITILKNMTEKELYDHFSKYIAASILLFMIFGPGLAWLSTVVNTDAVSFSIRLFILLFALIVAIMIWTFNFLIARSACNKGLISQ